MPGGLPFASLLIAFTPPTVSSTLPPDVDFDPLENDPAAPAVRPDEKEELELRKLRADTRRAEHESRGMGRSEILRLFSTLLPAVTVIISVVGLLLSLRSQLRQDQRNAANRREDQFTAALRDFASPSEAGQLSALITLEPFWGDTVFHARLQDLLVAALQTDRPREVHALIQKQFVEHADLRLLQALAVQNRDLAGRIRDVQHATAFIQGYRVRPADPLAVQSDSFTPLGDSLTMRVYDQLGRNISSLVQVINRVRVVHDVDLSGIVLSRLAARVSSDRMELSLDRLDHAEPAGGLRFERVRLRGAFLPGLTFRGATFDAVDLDSANLTQFECDSCTVTGGSSLAAFRSWVYYRLPGMVAPLGKLDGSRWVGGTIDAVRFYPALAWQRQAHPLSDYVSFLMVDWNIASGPPPKIARRLGITFPLRGTDAELPNVIIQ